MRQDPLKPVNGDKFREGWERAFGHKEKTQPEDNIDVRLIKGSTEVPNEQVISAAKTLAKRLPGKWTVQVWKDAVDSKNEKWKFQFRLGSDMLISPSIEEAWRCAIFFKYLRLVGYGDTLESALASAILEYRTIKAKMDCVEQRYPEIFSK